MKRAGFVLSLLLVPALAPAQAPAAAPAAPAAAAQIEARRAQALAETVELAGRMHERVVCALYPSNRRGLPAFKAGPRGDLSFELTAQVDLAAWRDWVAELTPRLRRLADDVEAVRLVKEPAGYRFETPGREFDASQFVVVDGFAEVPRALGAHVYTFDLPTAAAIREAFRQPRDKKRQTEILVQFRGAEGPLSSARQRFSVSAGPECIAPFVESRVRYRRTGVGAAAVKCPVLSFKSRKTVRIPSSSLDPKALRGMTAAWTVCLPSAEADAAAGAASPSAALFRDARGRVVVPRRHAAPAAASAGAAAPSAVPAPSAAAEEEARRRAEARALRQQADAATAAAVRAGGAAFLESVRRGARGKAAADAVESFQAEDLTVVCVDASRERPGAAELSVSGEAYLASQLWAKWRMRAKTGADGAIVPGEPVWTLSPSFQPPEYIRGAARFKPFPALSLDDPGIEPPQLPSRDPFSLGAVALALGALALLAGTGVLLWIEIRRKAAEKAAGRENPDEGPAA